MKFPDMEKPLTPGLEIMAMRIAKATHEFWLLDMTRMGWRPGLETNEEKKVHAWLLGWKRLPQEVQDEYLKKARAMPWILWRAGFEARITTEELLTKMLISNKGGKDGTKLKGHSGKSEAGTKPRAGGGTPEQPEKQKSAGAGAEDSGSGSGKDPSPTPGEGSAPGGDTSEGDAGKIS